MAGPDTIIATEANFGETVLESPQPVLVDFWTETCPPCRMVAPVLDELATEYKGKARIAKVNAAENLQLASQFRVNAVPAFFLVKNGEVVEQMVGARSKKDFKAMIDRAIA
jgi:thioredoxin 1